LIKISDLQTHVPLLACEPSNPTRVNDDGACRFAEAQRDQPEQPGCEHGFSAEGAALMCGLAHRRMAHPRCVLPIAHGWRTGGSAGSSRQALAFDRDDSGNCTSQPARPPALQQREAACAIASECPLYCSCGHSLATGSRPAPCQCASATPGRPAPGRRPSPGSASPGRHHGARSRRVPAALLDHFTRRWPSWSRTPRCSSRGWRRSTTPDRPRRSYARARRQCRTTRPAPAPCRWPSPSRACG
jgi:hypothetical protein